ncbi:MAG: DUF4440 domain-containing protein [Ignavibacteriaceae bacterium]|nr:DUF4440 domain-containing protein [Ignavibacteriaceae bacterium]
MRLLVLIFCLFQLGVLSQTITESESKENSIKEMMNNKMKEWMEAYNSGDASGLIPLYDENAEYISSHVNGLVASGRDRLIKNFAIGMKMGGHIDKVEILSINHSCEITSLVCRYEATNNGEKAIGRNLIVLKNIKGEWKIITHMTVV